MTGVGQVRGVSRGQTGRPYWPLKGVELMCSTKSLGALSRGCHDLISCFKKKDRLLCREGSVCLGWVCGDGASGSRGARWQVMVEPLGEVVAWREAAHSGSRGQVWRGVEVRARGPWALAV